MQRAGRLGDVVDIDGASGDMLVRGIVANARMDAAFDLFSLEIECACSWLHAASYLDTCADAAPEVVSV